MFKVYEKYFITATGQRNCPLGSPHLIRICQPLRNTKTNHFYMEFSLFEHTDANSCQCTFIAPTHGNFKMAPITFNPVRNCSTKVEISINRVVIPGGVVKCRPDQFLPATAFSRDVVAVTVSRTSSARKIAPYFYEASFPVNVTLTCNGYALPNLLSTCVKSKTTSIFRRTKRSTKVESANQTSTLRTTSIKDVPMNSIKNGSEDDKKDKTELCLTVTEYFYISGLALQTVIICILLGIIGCICRRRRNEREDDKPAHMYDECIRSMNESNPQSYDTLKDTHSNNTYANMTLF